MYYIGTSLGKCLKSIMLGEMSEDDVLVIITGTTCRTIDKYMAVVNHYYERGNNHVPDSNLYRMTGFDKVVYTELAQRLWDTGRIHQPNLLPWPELGPWGIKGKITNQTWLQIIA